MIKMILKALVTILPWNVRRPLLNRFWMYEIHPEAWIGYAWIFPEKLKLEAGSKIGHLTVCKGLSLLHLGEKASIGRGNWITAFPRSGSIHFSHQKERMPELIVGRHAAITNRHLIDCTNRVEVGEFATIAGFRSQILTHSIDLIACRQHSAQITIGRYCFVGTGCTLLGGARLPDYCVLGASSLLNKNLGQSHRLYGGVPARELKILPAGLGYFNRLTGYVK